MIDAARIDIAVAINGMLNEPMSKALAEAADWAEASFSADIA